MSVSVTMPRLGESVTEGTVTRWLKHEGDQVEADEPLLEVSTDKVDTEVPSPASGVLTSIKVQEDETVDIGVELAVIGDAAGEDSSAPAVEERPAEPPSPSRRRRHRRPSRSERRPPTRSRNLSERRPPRRSRNPPHQRERSPRSPLRPRKPRRPRKPPRRRKPRRPRRRPHHCRLRRRPRPPRRMRMTKRSPVRTSPRWFDG